MCYNVLKNLSNQHSREKSNLPKSLAVWKTQRISLIFRSLRRNTTTLLA